MLMLKWLRGAVLVAGCGKCASACRFTHSGSCMSSDCRGSAELLCICQVQEIGEIGEGESRGIGFDVPACAP